MDRFTSPPPIPMLSSFVVAFTMARFPLGVPPLFGDPFIGFPTFLLVIRARLRLRAEAGRLTV